MQIKKCFEMMAAGAALGLFLTGTAAGQTEQPPNPGSEVEGPQPCLHPGPLRSDNGVLSIEFAENPLQDCKVSVRVTATNGKTGFKQQQVFLDETIELLDGETEALSIETNGSLATVVTRGEVVSVECSQGPGGGPHLGVGGGPHLGPGGGPHLAVNGVYQGFIGQKFVGVVQGRVDLAGAVSPSD